VPGYEEILRFFLHDESLAMEGEAEDPMKGVKGVMSVRIFPDRLPVLVK